MKIYTPTCIQNLFGVYSALQEMVCVLPLMFTCYIYELGFIEILTNLKRWFCCCVSLTGVSERTNSFINLHTIFEKDSGANQYAWNIFWSTHPAIRHISRKHSDWHRLNLTLIILHRQQSEPMKGFEDKWLQLLLIQLQRKLTQFHIYGFSACGSRQFLRIVKDLYIAFFEHSQYKHLAYKCAPIQT